jgi:hypothetical protein
MRDLNRLLLFLLLCALTASAGSKESGKATLKNVEPVGTTSKQDKHQQFDFSFEASGKKYTCRSPLGKAVSATDYVVGSDLDYEIKGNSGKLKNSAGKEVKCTIVRVEGISAAP